MIFTSLCFATVRFVSVPFDAGANIKGAAQGPATLQKSFKFDTITIKCDNRDNVAIFEDIKRNVLDIVKNNDFPVCFGGDHSIAIGSGAAVSNYASSILWMDAHADFNTPESSETQNLHGMPLAILHGLGSQNYTSICDSFPSRNNIHIFGARDIDAEESKLLEKYNIKCTTMSTIKRYGVDYCMRQVIRNLPGRIHLSFDVDVMDPSVCPGVSTPVSNGLDYEQLEICLQHLNECKRVRSLDIVEFNPLFDENEKTISLIRFMLKYMGLLT